MSEAKPWLEYGRACYEQGDLAQALKCFSAALDDEASRAEAYNGRGTTLYAMGREDEAIKSFDAALALAPDYWQARNNRAVLLQNAQRYEESLIDVEYLLRLDDTNAGTHGIRGRILLCLNRFADVLDCYPRMNGHDLYEEAFCRLSMGDFARGWPLNEHRWQTYSMQAARTQLKRRDYVQPLWLGKESLVGKTIFLWPEQGYGDTLQFCRYVHLVQRMGAKVLVATDQALLRLLKQAFVHPDITVVLDLESSPYRFDFHCPMMSLPLACGTDSLEKIPADVPYLFAPPEHPLLQATSSKGLRVGLVWAGGLRSKQPELQSIDTARSLRLMQFEPLLRLADSQDIQFFSLQLGEPATQLQARQTELPQAAPIIDLTADLHDWADTAALIASLDLVISCDTAVAHLAAAMGKPTWILSRFNGCWRWLQDRNDSPWYPSVRLFRQKTRGDWDSVIAEVAQALRLLRAMDILTSYDVLLQQRSADPEVIFSRGVVLDDVGRFDEALACYLQALAIHPDHAGANQNASFLLLQQGQFEEGWRLYEQRWRLPQRGLTWQDFPRPVWRGESLAGKHILIWTEQGFGDIFQFSRYALVLQSRGAAKVTLLTLEGKCKRLFEHSFAPAGIDVVDEVAMRNGLLVPAFDVHCPLMSLPFACKTNSIDKVPAHVPYLFAQPTAAQNWQEKIAQATTAQSVQPTQRVGLCWAGGSKLGDDAERSLTLAQFGVLVALTKTGGVQFFSLQMGEPAAQLQGLPMADLTAGLTDWADTAALVANLDLVIACDTAVAHLAAAMGKPTWILSRFNGCWRWLQERSDSPWYPSVRLFRQKTRSDWNGVMAEVANALKTLSS